MRTGRQVVELRTMPPLARTYVKGVTTSAVAMMAPRRPVAPEQLPAVDLRVHHVRADVERLTAYQHLVGEPAGDVLPAGFLHVLAFPLQTALMIRGDFPLPLLGMVHVANRVEQHRPVRLDAPLDVQVGARDLRPHHAGTVVDLVGEISVDGLVVWSGTSTYLARGVRVAGAARPEKEPRFAWIPPTPTGQWRLGADVGRQYAEVSGDRNPIHTSALAAKAFGFPRAIAHGMYTAARALADVGPAARGDAYRWDVEFAAPVLLPGTASVRVSPDDDGYGFVAWDARRARKHLEGRVVPLG
ncbi:MULTISPECIES: MaoC/PaaZ C-terminal domain-containing protein [unclassified Actinotalea]|uniref:MaoC/PaaZ C-terminal domain-containing protein n=1 Tax=unclassified Actinotalea TaxID=2638618 RepID=UPI0015F75115|nr:MULTISPECIES: MaoC/PaaZ C-terminal domain-containing protein [unclassified Actinotalea]